MEPILSIVFVFMAVLALIAATSLQATNEKLKRLKLKVEENNKVHDKALYHQKQVIEAMMVYLKLSYKEVDYVSTCYSLFGDNKKEVKTKIVFKSNESPVVEKFLNTDSNVASAYINNSLKKKK